MSAAQDLTDGVAALLAANATPTITWHPASGYSDSETGIYRKKLPAGGRAIAISVVFQGDDPSLPLGKVMVQLRARGSKNDPIDVDNLLDSCFDVLHGTTNLAMGACTVVQMNRSVSVPLGMDDATGWERADQYYLDVSFPPTITRPAAGSW